MWTAGEAAGAFIFPPLADRFGRKPVCVIAMFVAVSLSISASFVDYYVYVILRALIGAFQQVFIHNRSMPLKQKLGITFSFFYTCMY